MSEHIEVTEDGEIIARHVDGEVGAKPDVLGYWWVRVEHYDVELAILPTATLAAWCRRVLREVAPDPVPTVDEVMAAWGVDDLRIHASRNGDGVSDVWIDSEKVGCRTTDLTSAGCKIPRAHGRFGGLIGHGANHAEALRNALANAAGPWGDLP